MVSDFRFLFVVVWKNFVLLFSKLGTLGKGNMLEHSRRGKIKLLSSFKA